MVLSKEKVNLKESIIGVKKFGVRQADK